MHRATVGWGYEAAKGKEGSQLKRLGRAGSGAPRGPEMNWTGVERSRVGSPRGTFHTTLIRGSGTRAWPWLAEGGRRGLLDLVHSLAPLGPETRHPSPPAPLCQAVRSGDLVAGLAGAPADQVALTLQLKCLICKTMPQDLEVLRP